LTGGTIYDTFHSVFLANDIADSILGRETMKIPSLQIEASMPSAVVGHHRQPPCDMGAQTSRHLPTSILHENSGHPLVLVEEHDLSRL
jgi:hypothetical protein